MWVFFIIVVKLVGSPPQHFGDVFPHEWFSGDEVELEINSEPRV